MLLMLMLRQPLKADASAAAAAVRDESSADTCIRHDDDDDRKQRRIVVVRRPACGVPLTAIVRRRMPAGADPQQGGPPHRCYDCVGIDRVWRR